MSEQDKSDRSDKVDNGFGDFEDGEDLFKDIIVENEQNEQPRRHKKLKKMKKQKKSKKEKKDKKKRRRHQQQDQQEYDDENQQDEQIGSMFEDEAESDQNSEQYSVDGSAEIGQEDQVRKFKELMEKPRAIGNYFKKFDGKNDKVINAMYSRGVNMLRQSEAMYPAENDPKMFVINVRPRHEDQIVIFLLNKARHLAETSEKVLVVTATAMKKKFAGKIFVQAFSQKDVRDALEHLPNVSLTKNLLQLDREGYAELFNEKYEQKVDFKQENFVQIKKGLYQDDLAQIIKIRANSADVIVVPRLNVKQIAKKIHEHTSKITDDAKKRQKMAELLTLFLDHKAKNYKERPPKKNLSQEQLRQQLGDNPACKKIRLSGHPPGLIVLNYKFDQIAKHSGTYNPIQFLPFTTTQGNFITKMNEQKGHLTTVTNYKKGQQVQIISGGMIGHFGVIYQVKDSIATIVCKNKQLFNEKIEEPIQNIVKKFKQGQRVKVISGADIGKTGTVLKIQQKVVQLWTDNQNSIRVNKKNLQVSSAEMICAQNVHNLTKHDLIKTTKNQIGIVLETTKDNIKILDTNNTIQIIGNLDFDSKLNTRNIIAKNRSGDQVGAGCLVIIRNGANQGKKCKVIHVYRQNVFLFNAAFNRTAGIAVENAENCSLMSKNQAPQQRSFSTKNNQSTVGAADSNKDEITVGKSIILRTGPLKGYQGIVKSINKDKIEVRVLSKACTEWVPRENVTTKQEAMEVGKTPNRRGGNTHAYAPSPSRY